MSERGDSNDTTMHFNGINGATGEYLLPPMKPNAFFGQLRGDHPEDAAVIRQLMQRHRSVEVGEYGPAEGIDPKDLSSAGWGIIFAHGADPAVKERLHELLAHRRAQAGEHFRVFDGEHAYRRGESVDDFLARHGVGGTGPVDPCNGMPYYLLLVGSPEEIPFTFQYLLDVSYAVGRIHFDTLDEYERYARSTVEAETCVADDSGPDPSQRVVFFSVTNDGDRATARSAEELAVPLAQRIQEEQARKGWVIESTTGADATHARLRDLLGGPSTPAFLFTSSHGMGFPLGHPRQLEHQGALVCADWPGPMARGRTPIPDEGHYFSAGDIPDDARLSGLISFHFACYGAGVPHYDDFAHHEFRRPTEIASRAFVSRLPQRMLGHPNGGALAAVGHVERAWTYSFRWRGLGRQTQVFRDVLTRLLQGHPLGSAMEPLNQRYAEISTRLNDKLEAVKFGKRDEDLEVVGLWTAHHDARNYMVIGDPAVRLAAPRRQRG